MRQPRARMLYALLAAIGFSLASPVLGAEKFTLKSSGAQTAAGQGSSVDIGNWRHLTVFVSVTAGSGTVTVFRVWLEATPNNGTTWFEVPCVRSIKTGAAAPGAGSINQRDIVNETAVQTSAQYLANCELYGQDARAAWNITGTSPSETFSVTAFGK